MSRKLGIPIGLFVLAFGAAVLFLTGPFEDPPVSRTPSPPADGDPAHGAAASPGERAPGEPGSVEEAAPAATLFGTVSDLAGEPLVGARVLVRTANDLPSLQPDALELALRERALGREQVDLPSILTETTTDGSGKYSFVVSTWPPRQYTVLAAASGKAPRGEPWTWTLEPTRLDFRLPDGDAISGLVRGPEGRAVPGATVSAREESGDWDPAVRSGILAARALADERGRFVLDVGGGIYVLTAEARGFAAGELRHVPSGSEVVVGLEPGRALVGTVRDRETEVIAGARVTLYRNRRSSQRAAAGWLPRNELQRRMFSAALGRTETDERGAFRFADLATGGHRVLVEKTGFRTTERSVVVLEDASTTKIDVVLRASSVLKGQVRDEDGAPVAAALVSLDRDRRLPEGPVARLLTELSSRERALQEEGRFDELEKLRVRMEAIRAYEAERGARSSRRPVPLSRALAAAETDEEGRFRIDTIGEGSYLLSVRAKDFIVHRQEGVSVGPGETALDIVLARGIRLEGRVLSSDSPEGVSGAAVLLRRSVRGAGRSDAEVRRVQANEAGEYVVGGLFPGDRWDFEARARGYSPASLEGVEIVAEDRVHHLDIVLDPGAAVSGRVVDASGQPLSRVRVRLARGASEFLYRLSALRARGGDEMEVDTDGAGRFSLEGITPGPSIRLALSRHDYREYLSESFDLAAGERVDGMEIQMETGGRLLVAVADADGQPLRGARVRLWRESPEPRGVDRDALWERARLFQERLPKRSDAGGEVLFFGLEGGRYTVSCEARGFQPFSGTVDVIEGKTLEHPLRLLPENVITGVVVDTSGTPIPDVLLRATARDPEVSPVRWHRSLCESDEDGRFVLGSLGPGPHDLFVEHDRFAKLRLEAVEVNGEYRLELERLASLTGRIVAAETSLPVTRFEIRLLRKGRVAAGSPKAENGPAGGTRDSNGEGFAHPEGAFRLDRLQPGEYVLEVRARGFATSEVNVRLEEGRVLEELEVRLTRES